jgi:upstream activation factor subunit UAF30
MDMIADDRKKDKSFENGTSDATESEKSESEPSSASTDDEDYKPVPTKRGKAASSKPAAAKPAAKKPRKKKAESSASDSDEEEPEKEKKKPPPKKAAAGGGGGGGAKKSSTYSRKCILSPELAEVVGAPEMARHDVVKKMWEIVKGRNLYDPSNKQFAICDDQLYKVFGVKRFRTFGMMKYLKTHIKDPAK